jgi:L-fucose isomerase-like protein
MAKGMNRRQFMGTTAGAVAVGAAVTAAASKAVAAQSSLPEELRGTKTRIGKVYVGRERSGWPNPAVDVKEDVKKYEAELAELKPKLEDIEFVDGGLVTSNEGLAKAKEKFKDVDGILAIHLSLGTGPLITGLLELGVPVVVFAKPYAGHEWHIIASLQKQGKKIEMYPSSKTSDILKAIRPIRTIHRLREAKVLHLPGGKPDEQYIEAIRKKYGTQIKTIALDDLTKRYEAADKTEVAKETQRWIDDSLKIVEPKHEDISRAARMYIAMRDLLVAEKAHAITLNCLGSGLIQKGQAYPCFGFSRLSGMGVPGVCEADLKSTITALIFQYLVNRAGFITDPVIDLSNNTIIHAHCVAPLKMDGPDGEECDYIIRSHLEDLKGASLFVKMRIGQKISMARLIGTDIMLFSTGEIVDTPYVDRGCRTKITTKVADAQKIMEGWSSGLHRVIFYGDHSRDIRRLARFLDFRVVEEGVDDPKSVPGLEWNPSVHA